MASKMYILLRDAPWLDLGHAVLTAAHASLSGYLTFVEWETGAGYFLYCGSDQWNARALTPTQAWAKESFRKVICRVTDEQFEAAKLLGENMKTMRVMTESAFDNAEVAIVFRPIDLDDPNHDKKLGGFLRGLKLYK